MDFLKIGPFFVGRENTVREERIVKDCPLTYRCPLHWSELKGILSVKDVRYCTQCEKSVYFCKNDDEIKAHAEKGNCIAYVNPNEPIMMGVALPARDPRGSDWELKKIAHDRLTEVFPDAAIQLEVKPNSFANKPIEFIVTSYKLAVVITSAAFAGMPPTERQRSVSAALEGVMLRAGDSFSLTIEALAPAEGHGKPESSKLVATAHDDADEISAAATFAEGRDSRRL